MYVYARYDCPYSFIWAFGKLDANYFSYPNCQIVPEVQEPVRYLVTMTACGELKDAS